jgi:hypothetical protein
MKIWHEINEIVRNGGKEISFLLVLLKFITIFIFHESYCLFISSLFRVSADCNSALLTDVLHKI